MIRLFSALCALVVGASGVISAEPSSTAPSQSALAGLQLSPDQVRAAKAAYSGSKGVARITGTGSPAATDSLAAMDIADSLAQKQAEERQLTVYERMARGLVVDPDSMRADLRPFGYEVFRSLRRSVANSSTAGVPDDYPLSPGDELVFTLWGRLNEESRAVIGRDGNVNVPHIGQMPVSGLSFRAARESIVGQLQSIEGVKASLSAGTLSDIKVFVVGEVVSPGQYGMSALTGIVNALYTAGGITRSASLRTVTLKRGNAVVGTFDLYDFLLSGNNFSDVRLKNNDVIVVGVAKKMAAVVGNVRRSAFYELKEKASLRDLISLAGGLAATAWTNRIQIDRFTPDSGRVVVDVSAETPGTVPVVEIRDGDIVKVLPSIAKDLNAVFVAGNVMRPGKIAFHAGMRVSDVIGSFRDLLPNSYLPYAVVKRSVPPAMLVKVVSFDLGTMLSDSASVENLFLEPGDSVVAYPRSFFEPENSVSVGGAVTRPGMYFLMSEMHIRDLVLQAGGFTENASVERGELYRRIAHGDSIATVKIDFSVSGAMQDEPAANLPLERGDQVFIRQKRGWEDRKAVAILGEVTYPGTYVITAGEDMGALIDRAGGFTSNAFLPAAVFSKASVKLLERKRIAEYTNKLEADINVLTQELATGNPENQQETVALLAQQKGLLERLKMTEPMGRVVVDFANDDEFRSLPLDDGDTLFVPRPVNTVSVMGEVFNPATFALKKKSTNALAYMEMAGGGKADADVKNVYVIKASGSVVTKKMERMSKYCLGAGDAVVVPQKIRVETGRFKEVLGTINSVATLTANSLSIATNILLLRAATK